MESGFAPISRIYCVTNQLAIAIWKFTVFQLLKVNIAFFNKYLIQINESSSKPQYYCICVQLVI
jgi:hypothetical protein